MPAANRNLMYAGQGPIVMESEPADPNDFWSGLDFYISHYRRLLGMEQEAPDIQVLAQMFSDRTFHPEHYQSAVPVNALTSPQSTLQMMLLDSALNKRFSGM